jgi:hypothetical protein
MPDAPTPTTGDSHTATTTSGTQVLTYNGSAFSISYPAAWSLEDAEQPESYGTDTTIESPANPNTLIRVDVNTNGAATPQAAASRVIATVAQQPGYQKLALARTTIGGFPALQWVFTVDQAGTELEKEDDFIVDPATGLNVALLTQAPATQYGTLATLFAAIRQTLTIGT